MSHLDSSPIDSISSSILHVRDERKRISARSLSSWTKGQRQCRCCPVCRGGGYPLVFSERKAALEIRLQRDRPRLDIPGPILVLGPKQEVDTALVGRVG